MLDRKRSPCDTAARAGWVRCDRLMFLFAVLSPIAALYPSSVYSNFTIEDIGRAWLPAPDAAVQNKLPDGLWITDQGIASNTQVTIKTWADVYRDQPSLAWTDVTLNLITKYQQNPLRAARNLVYLHVAMHDAIVRAREVELDRHGQTLALHSAASSMLEYLYPQEPMGRFGSLGRSAIVRTRMKDQSDFSKAWEMGRAVALLAIDRATKDGADQAWDIRKRPADRPGLWQASPPLNIYKPAEPMAGKWRTWVLTSAEEIEVPPPVRYDSPEYWKEAEQILAVTEQLTAEQKQIAEHWNLGLGTVTPAGVWNMRAKEIVTKHRLDSAQTAAVYAALNVAMMDAFIACWNIKFAYWTQRPVTAVRARLKADFMPHLITPPFPSYVSGHSTVSGAASEVLAAFFPQEAETFRAMAREAAISRLYGGIHFESDNNEGLRLGQQIGRKTAQKLGISTVETRRAENVSAAKTEPYGMPARPNL